MAIISLDRSNYLLTNQKFRRKINGTHVTPTRDGNTQTKSSKIVIG